MTAQINPDVQAMAQKLLDNLAEGGTVGDFLKITRPELDALYAAGYEFYDNRKFDKAVNIFRMLCMCDHLEARWYVSLGMALQQKGDHENAVNAYALATLLNIDDPVPQIQAGYCLLAMGKHPEAKAALEGAILVCNDNPAVYAEVKKQAEALLATATKRTAKGE